MTTTSKISKRDVMTRAWRIYRSGNYSKSFGECLSRAWKVEKENAVYRAEQAKIEAWNNCPRIEVVITEEMKEQCYQAKVTAMASLYASGVYSGD